MKAGSILRESFRITAREWRLWLLTLLTFMVAVPSMLLAGSFGTVVMAIDRPLFLPEWPWLDYARSLPGWLLGLGAILTLLVMIVTSALTWILYAAAMRGVAAAAENRPYTLKELLAMGMPRLRSILVLCFTLGVLIGLLGFAPTLLQMIIPPTTAGQLFSSLSTTVLAPFNAALSIAMFLLILSIALEDVRPKTAYGRAWYIFRQAWWLFLLVFLLSIFFAFGVVLLMVPFFVVLIMAIILQQGWGLVLVFGAITLPLTLGFLLFTSVFTTVMYTLSYKAAANLPPPMVEEYIPA